MLKCYFYVANRKAPSTQDVRSRVPDLSSADNFGQGEGGGEVNFCGRILWTPLCSFSLDIFSHISATEAN